MTNYASLFVNEVIKKIKIIGKVIGLKLELHI